MLLLGARRRSRLHIADWWLFKRRMRALLRELEAAPEIGLLGWEMWGGASLLTVQYWRSWEALESWSRERGGSHRAAWTEYLRGAAKRGSVGVWHEAYIAKPGAYETVYTCMPPIGLARVGDVVPARGRLGRAAGRMRASLDGELKRP